jgi:hypothetical protein
MKRSHAELISAYFDDSLSPEEAIELRTWLDADPANWRTFVRESVIHSRLREVLMQHDMRSLVFDEAFVDTVDPDRIASLLDEEEAKQMRRRLEAEELAEQQARLADRQRELLDRKSLRIDQPRSPQWMVYAGVAAAAALLLAAFQMFAPAPAPAPSGEGPSAAIADVAPTAAPPIAEFASAFDAELLRGDEELVLGAALRPGRLVLRRGVAQVKFASDVTMIVEGPAEIELLSADRARLNRGRVVVQVPKQALGFTLHSDAAAFVDLGTEFGVEVTEPGRANIHVLDGEVAFVPENGGGPSRTLQRGSATEVTTSGVIDEVAFDDQKFVRRVPNSAYELAVLKSRPLAYWRLDDVAAGAELQSEGKLGLASLVRSGVTSVQRPDKPGEKGPARSARFIEEHEGIDVTPHERIGIVSNCTYEAWVLPTDGAGPQRIFSTFDRPHSGMAIGVVGTSWYELPEDELRFHLTVYGRYDAMATSPLTPGKWVHVAATIDAEGTPTMFVDGREVDRRFRPIRALSDEPQEMLTDAEVFLGDGPDEEKEEPPRPWLEEQETPLGVVTSGAARIGRNPDGSDGKISPECWQGQISNVAVYDRVLSPAEIRSHMEATRDATTRRQDRGSSRPGR